MHYITSYSCNFQNFIPSFHGVKNNLARFHTKVGQTFSLIREIAKINFLVYFDSNQQPRIHKKLKVKEVSPNEKETLIKTVDAWRAFAETKAAQTALLLPNLFWDHLPSPFYSKRFDIFQSSFNICSDIHNSLVKKPEVGHKEFYAHLKEKVFICCLDQPDGQDTIQAVAIISEVRRREEAPYLYIAYLASRPQNLISPLNKQQPHRIAKAASELINYLAKKVCPASNLERIELTTGATSKEFYKKLGFREDSCRMILDLIPNRPLA